MRRGPTAIALLLALASPVLGGCSPLLAALLAGRSQDAGRIALGQTVSANTTGASDVYEPTCGNPDHAGDHAWAFVPPEAGRYRFHVTAEYDSVLTVFRGHDDGDVVDCNDDSGSTQESEVIVNLEAGELYTVLVDGYSGDEGHYTLTVDRLEATIGGALVLDQPVEGNTMDADNAHTPSCGNAFGPDHAWRFVPPRPDTYVATLHSSYDGVLAVYDEDGAELVCNDDYLDTSTSRVVLPLQPGRTYLVVVDGYNGGAGAYTLEMSPYRGEEMPPEPMEPMEPPTVEAVPVPAADDVAALEQACAQAPSLPLGRTVGYLDPASSRAATSCGGGGAGAERVYRLLVPQRSLVRIAQESLFDGVLEVRRGCSEGHQVLACVDDTGDANHAVVEAMLDPGEYFVVVDSYAAGYEGAYSLAVDVTPMGQ